MPSLFATLFTVSPLLIAPGTAAPNAKDAAVDTHYLREHAQTRGFMLGRPMRPYPTPDGKAVLFLRSGPRAAKLGLFEFDVATGKTRELLTPEQVLKGAEEKLSPEEKAARERMRVSVGGFTSFPALGRRQPDSAQPVRASSSCISGRMAPSKNCPPGRASSSIPSFRPTARWFPMSGITISMSSTSPTRKSGGSPPAARRRSRMAWRSSSPRKKWPASPATGGRPTAKRSSTRKPTTRTSESLVRRRSDQPGPQADAVLLSAARQEQRARQARHRAGGRRQDDLDRLGRDEVSLSRNRALVQGGAAADLRCRRAISTRCRCSKSIRKTGKTTTLLTETTRPG